MTPDLGEEQKVVTDSNAPECHSTPGSLWAPSPYTLGALSGVLCAFPLELPASWPVPRAPGGGGGFGGSQLRQGRGFQREPHGSLALPQELPEAVRKPEVGAGPRSPPGPSQSQGLTEVRLHLKNEAQS